MNKRIFALAVFCLVAPFAQAAVLGDVQIEGQVSKIHADRIDLYSKGLIIEIPKSLVQNPSRLHTGQNVLLEMPLAKSRELVRREIAVANPEAAKR